MVGYARSKEAYNHGRTTNSGEEDESGRIRDDVEEVKYMDLFPHEVVNESSGKSLAPSIGGGTSFVRGSDKKVNF